MEAFLCYSRYVAVVAYPSFPFSYPFLSLEDDAVPPEVQAKAWEDVSFGDAHKGWREKQCRSIKRLVGTVNGPGRIPRVAVRSTTASVSDIHACMHEAFDLVGKYVGW